MKTYYKCIRNYEEYLEIDPDYVSQGRTLARLYAPGEYPQTWFFTNKYLEENSVEVSEEDFILFTLANI